MDTDIIVSFEDFPAYLQTRRIALKYNSQTEQKPNHPWFSFDKATVDRILKTLTHEVTELLKGAPKCDSELMHLDRTAVALSNVLRSPAIKVALLGAQGAGKSLAVNAIFDHNGLSLTGAEGAACTSSITKYVYFPQNTTGENMFHAQIKFLSPGKRNAQLAEHACHYYHYHHADDEFENDSGGQPGGGQDESDRKLRDDAEDMFTTLFGSVDNFQDVWTAPTYKSGEFVRLCQMKADEALARENIDTNDFASKMASTQQELLKQLRPFMASVEGQVCLWPLVDHIAVQFYHPLLEQRIELFDLPGWGDTNSSRARHAEEIRESVDVEIILADTIRVKTDEQLISSTRAAIAHHGASSVKVVATKIDSVTPNQLAQSSGEKFDIIHNYLQKVEEREAAIDDCEDPDGENNFRERRDLEQYRYYLERTRKQMYIADRAKGITEKLAERLQGRSPKDVPQIFHISASDYMDWTKKPKIAFTAQPSLTAEMTGIPAIRTFLYGLAADQNLHDYEQHIGIVVQAFLEKIKRTVAEDERDADFQVIANNFDELRKDTMSRRLSEAKSAFRNIFNVAIEKLEADIPIFKKQVSDKLTQNWFTYRGAAFTKILKSRGLVPKGASKAAKLQGGCNWNKEIAVIMTVGFQKWLFAHSERMEIMGPVLAKVFAHMHHKVIKMFDNSSANLVTVEKAKKKWDPLRQQIQIKTEFLMKDVSKLQKLMYDAAIIAFDQQRNPIAHVTDDIYVEVLEAEPAVKAIVTSRTGALYKKYVEPKIRFQQERMQMLFLSEDNHLVDRVLGRFQAEFHEKMDALLDEHFAAIDKLLEGYSTNIKTLSSVPYMPTDDGKAIRADLAQRIPAFEEEIETLHKLLPQRPKPEAGQSSESDDNFKFDDSDDSFENIMDKMSRRKRTESSSNMKQNNKRIKTEPF